MNEFKVKATFPYGGWIISKVYGIDNSEKRFLLVDFDGRIYIRKHRRLYSC